MEMGKWTIRGKRSDNFKYLCDDLRAKIYSSRDSDNMRRFSIRFPKPATKSDQHISIKRYYFKDSIEYNDSVSLYLYEGKIVYGWVWWKIPTGLGHPVNCVVYNARDLGTRFPDAVAFLRQEGILEKTWLQQMLSIFSNIAYRFLPDNC